MGLLTLRRISAFRDKAAVSQNMQRRCRKYYWDSSRTVVVVKLRRTSALLMSGSCHNFSSSQLPWRRRSASFSSPATNLTLRRKFLSTSFCGHLVISILRTRSFTQNAALEKCWGSDSTSKMELNSHSKLENELCVDSRLTRFRRELGNFDGAGRAGVVFGFVLR